MNKEYLIQSLLISSLVLLVIGLFSPLISQLSFIGIQTVNIFEILLYRIFQGVEFFIPLIFLVTLMIGLVSIIGILNYKKYYNILMIIGWLSLIINGLVVTILLDKINMNPDLMIGWGWIIIFISNILLIVIGALVKNTDEF